MNEYINLFSGAQNKPTSSLCISISFLDKMYIIELGNVTRSVLAVFKWLFRMGKSAEGCV